MKLLYVADYTESIVLIYRQGKTGSGPIGDIVKGISNPEGVAVDKNGMLYVANNGNNTVTEYPPGSIRPKVTLSSGISDPLGISVDSNLVLYLTEPGTAGKVLEFKPGSTSPDVTVSMPHASQPTNARNNELYVTTSSQGRVERCKPLTTTCTDLGISVGFSQGLAIDLQGNLLVGDVYGPVIDIYHRGKTTPFRTITTTLEQPSDLKLNTTDSVLFMSDPANFAVRLFNYTAGTETSNFTFGSGDELEGIALFPGQKPGP
jgi:serine/threonine-protein kinase